MDAARWGEGQALLRGIQAAPQRNGWRDGPTAWNGETGCRGTAEMNPLAALRRNAQSMDEALKKQARQIAAIL